MSEQCPKCGGSGWIQIPCNNCHGTGFYTDIYSKEEDHGECEYCSGTGYTHSYCMECNGDGYIKVNPWED